MYKAGLMSTPIGIDREAVWKAELHLGGLPNILLAEQLNAIASHRGNAGLDVIHYIRDFRSSLSYEQTTSDKLIPEACLSYFHDQTRKEYPKEDPYFSPTTLSPSWRTSCPFMARVAFDMQ
jgi:hypothetical protein